jgi:rare lipoprotein A (peptidoglycan hydrolase)
VKDRFRRVLVLGAVALLAGGIALALDRGRDRDAEKLPEPAATWYTAHAAARAPARFGTKTACGHVIGPEAEGVGHPVLPCGAKLYVTLGETTVLTEVIDRVANVAPREFDLTAALAGRLGMRRPAQIRWTYARVK